MIMTDENVLWHTENKRWKAKMKKKWKTISEPVIICRLSNSPCACIKYSMLCCSMFSTFIMKQKNLCEFQRRKKQMEKNISKMCVWTSAWIYLYTTFITCFSWICKQSNKLNHRWFQQRQINLRRCKQQNNKYTIRMSIETESALQNQLQTYFKPDCTHQQHNHRVQQSSLYCLYLKYYCGVWSRKEFEKKKTEASGYNNKHIFEMQRKEKKIKGMNVTTKPWL